MKNYYCPYFVQLNISKQDLIDRRNLIFKVLAEKPDEGIHVKGDGSTAQRAGNVARAETNYQHGTN